MAEIDVVVGRYQHASKVQGRSLSISNRLTGKPAGGNGYLAGSYPEGITSIEGAPTIATVRIHLRATSGAAGDGMLIAEVQSAADGSWRVDGLDPDLSFDVIGRKAGFNDVIVANVRPATS